MKSKLYYIYIINNSTVTYNKGFLTFKKPGPLFKTKGYCSVFNMPQLDKLSFATQYF